MFRPSIHEALCCRPATHLQSHNWNYDSCSFQERASNTTRTSRGSLPAIPTADDGPSGGGGGGPRSEYAQLRPRRLPVGHRIIGGRAHAVTPAQEARLDITAAQARALVREVQRRDPSWKPTPSIYEGVEGRILANQSEVQQASARLRELGAREPAAKPLIRYL